MKSVSSCSHFFFFQAEDGIRDYKVTGVQTCALPILKRFAGFSPKARLAGIQKRVFSPATMEHNASRQPSGAVARLTCAGWFANTVDSNKRPSFCQAEKWTVTVLLADGCVVPAPLFNI